MNREFFLDIPTDIDGLHEVFDLVTRACAITEMGSRMDNRHEQDFSMLRDAHFVAFSMLEDAKFKMCEWKREAES